ncbi:MAG TPA: amidohydrolase family protein, partial [Clostridia bacterium]|nr:amidohydrolase family protein [Clostridia bacterium]
MEVIKNMDLVIQNGLVIDPETHLQQKMNIGIKNGRIAQLSQEKLQGKQVIEATGLIVAPGFIDLHVHEDTLSSTEGDKMLPLETAAALLHTGVTTMVGGNCGFSALPIKEQLETVKQAQLPLNYYTLVGYITL